MFQLLTLIITYYLLFLLLFFLLLRFHLNRLAPPRRFWHHRVVRSPPSPSNAFIARLGNPRPLLLDGGLATQLEAAGAVLDTTLWSAALLRDAPERIRDAHRAYLEAGAEVLATASYQASREGFTALGLSASEADELMAGSVALAREATEAAQRPDALVAASLGPWGAAQHDGSEYTGACAASDEELATFHAGRLEVMDSAGADVLAFETFPNLREIAVLAHLLEDVDTPAWVSFCCRDARHLGDGTKVEDAAALFRDHPRVVALGINCTAPQYFPGLIGRLRMALPELPLLVYPNSGEQYDAPRQCWTGTVDPHDVAEAARSWLRAGARGIGGCCRTGPEHIRAMATVIQEEHAP